MGRIVDLTLLSARTGICQKATTQAGADASAFWTKVYCSLPTDNDLEESRSKNNTPPKVNDVVSGRPCQ
jgi:hypothetical protein